MPFTYLHPAEAPRQVPFPTDGVHAREVVDLLQPSHPHDSLRGKWGLLRFTCGSHFFKRRRNLPEAAKYFYDLVLLLPPFLELVGLESFCWESNAVRAPALSLRAPKISTFMVA